MKKHVFISFLVLYFTFLLFFCFLSICAIPMQDQHAAVDQKGIYVIRSSRASNVYDNTLSYEKREEALDRKEFVYYDFSEFRYEARYDSDVSAVIRIEPVGVAEWKECLIRVFGGSRIQFFCGKLCVIEDALICCGGYDDDHIVYFKTNQGVFVRIYPKLALGKDDRNVYEMTEEEFLACSRERYQDYKEDHAVAEIRTIDYFKEHYPEVMHTQKLRVLQYRWIYRILTVLWIAGGITAVVIYNKRKKRPAADGPAADGPAPDGDPDAGGADSACQPTPPAETPPAEKA